MSDRYEALFFANRPTYIVLETFWRFIETRFPAMNVRLVRRRDEFLEALKSGNFGVLIDLGCLDRDA